MIDRAEVSGVGLAIVAHAGLLALLLWFATQAPATPPVLKSQPIEVTLTDEVALVSGAPDPSPEPPAARKSPVEAPIEPDSTPQPAAEPAKPQPAPPRDAIPDPSARRRPDRPAPAQTANSRPGNRPVTPSGRLDGLDLNAPSDRPSNSNSTKVQASTMTPAALSNIGSLIVQRTQPCADRQVSPAPEANRIRVSVTLRLNRDGSLAGPLTITGHENVDDSNSRYVTRVDDAVRAIFAGCSPIRGLPADLYDVPHGWRVFVLRYKLKS